MPHPGRTEECTVDQMTDDSNIPPVSSILLIINTFLNDNATLR